MRPFETDMVFDLARCEHAPILIKGRTPYKERTLFEGSAPFKERMPFKGRKPLNGRTPFTLSMIRLCNSFDIVNKDDRGKLAYFIFDFEFDPHPVVKADFLAIRLEIWNLSSSLGSMPRRGNHVITASHNRSSRSSRPQCLRKVYMQSTNTKTLWQENA